VAISKPVRNSAVPVIENDVIRINIFEKNVMLLDPAGETRFVCQSKALLRKKMISPL